MAPSPKKLEEALIDGTVHVYNTEPDATSVNKVRKHVEDALDLEEGFFNGEEWKQKSKALIKEYVNKLLDGWKPETQKKTQLKTPAKRQITDADSTSPKRQKQTSQTSKPGARNRVRNSDSEETKSKPRKRTDQRNSKVADSDKESGDNSPPAEKKARRKASSAPEKEEEEEEEDNSPAVNEREKSVDDAESSIQVDASQAAVDEEEEYSDVIDEPPKPKRKKQEKKESVSKPSKSSSKKVAASTPDNTEETEIKKLQSYLVKCGIRKLWHNELKKYGDDARAKIKHLKKMLADAGMDGRFSEAKAREIKERRELQAELEAAQEMNSLWGMDSGRRASRSKAKSMKVDDSEDEDAEDAGGVGGDRRNNDDEDSEQDTSFAARRRRAQADLAFLGDDSDSDE